ncbi:MAG: glycosyltransferase family 2 protein [Chloroflexales bacterium]|nr:glycosyltransferase family 2 protein [Chloroflexales bacterium]
MDRFNTNLVMPSLLSTQAAGVQGRYSGTSNGSNTSQYCENLPIDLLAQGAIKVSIVIPALNEAKNLPHVLPRIPLWVHEVLLVDGHSTDDTIAVAQQLRQDIRIVYQEGRGKGAALRSGFAVAQGDIIVMLDADGSTDPAEIPLFVGALLAGADFVKGSRFLQGGGTADMPLYRKLGNLSFVMSVRMLFGGSYSDLCYGYNAFWKDALSRLQLYGDGFEIETLMNIQALCSGLKVAEVPSFEAERVHGVGRLRSIPDGWRVLKTIVRERARQHHISALHRSKRSKNTLSMSDAPILPEQEVGRAL